MLISQQSTAHTGIRPQHRFPLQKLSQDIQADGSLFIIYCHYNYKPVNWRSSKFGCLWAVLSDNELSPQYMQYTNTLQWTKCSSFNNDAGEKWETTNHICVALAMVSIPLNLLGSLINIHRVRGWEEKEGDKKKKLPFIETKSCGMIL